MTETQVQPQQSGVSKLPPKQFFESPTIKNKFQELMGKRATAFVTSVLQLVMTDSKLAKADSVSIYNCASMAALLDLPINKNLGFAWIIAYGDQAQFQMGWKGYVQLAMRTGQYLKINAIEVYESQFVSWDSLKEDLILDTTKPESGKVVGYCAYFKMINGFEKVVYWPYEKVHGHGSRYSKSFNNGPWKTHFDDMAKKTVLKQALSKWGYLSIELQKAIHIDQAIIKDDSGEEVEYVDATPLELKPDIDTVNSEKEHKRVMSHIAKSKTLEQLQQVEQALTTDEQQEYYSQREKELSGKP